MQTYTKAQLVRKYKGKYLKVFHYQYSRRERDGWVGDYEVEGVSSKPKTDYILVNNI